MWVNSNIFYNSSGDFQWSSIAALISLIAAIVATGSSIYGVRKNNQTQRDIAKQNIDANLKSNARIEWIQDVRDEIAKFITNCTLYLEYSPKIAIGKAIIKDVSPTVDGAIISLEAEENTVENSDFEEIISSSEIEKIRVEINISANRLILFFGPDSSKSNYKIVELIEEIQTKVNNRKFYKGDKSEEDIKGIRDIIRKYLKVEWDRAKNGE